MCESIKKKISVIMGIYNCASTLPDAIESIVNQTYPDWQLIMCDDCSTDNTYKVAESYVKKYPNQMILIQNEQNMKLAYTLNHCLEYADGEYCARMDGDDMCAPDRFEKQVSFLNRHPEYAVVGTWMQAFNESSFGRTIQYKEFPTKYDLRFGPCFAHASIVMRAKVYKAIGGYTVSRRTVRTQDYDMWFRFYAHGYQGANLKESLYYVREDENSFHRRKAKLYLWAIVTRYKGFKLLKYPIYYYPRVLSPLPGLVYNELRKLTHKVK